MKVHELITALKDFPEDMEVWGTVEESDWVFDGESSREVSRCSEGLLQVVEKWTVYHGREVVRLS